MVTRLLGGLFRFLASLQLAILLLLVLGIVLARGTILETQFGAPHARWYVYGSAWFLALLALLAANIFAAAAIRFPWKRHQFGFVVTHCGLLVLLAGALMSLVVGVEGHVSLVEGESTNSMTLEGRSQITAYWVGKQLEPSFEFSFENGPVDWPSGKTLDLGEVDGVRARVLGFCRYPRIAETWQPDPNPESGPVVKFRIARNDGEPSAEGWLADQRFGEALVLGPLKLQLQRAETDRMLDDFVRPPAAELLGERGVLVMYLDDAVQRVPIDGHTGEMISIGPSGVTVEIVQYLANATPDKLGNFRSKDDQPRNPMIELRVHVAGESSPIRQIASARETMMNLDGIYGRVCPVKFRYYHPAVAPSSGLELLQTNDGRLFGRTCDDGTYDAARELRAGERLTLPGGFQCEIVQYWPHARRELRFEADHSPGARRPSSEPAALIEIAAGGKTQKLWMRRNDPVYGQQSIALPEGTMALQFEDARMPLDFSMQLIDFRQELNRGNAGNAAFSSQVRLADGGQPATTTQWITMNHPLTYGRYTFYQFGFDRAPDGREVSRFSVSYDPGRVWKYIGGGLVCIGIGIMFYMRAYSSRRADDHCGPGDGMTSLRTDAPSAKALPANDHLISTSRGEVAQSPSLSEAPNPAFVDGVSNCGKSIPRGLVIGWALLMGLTAAASPAAANEQFDWTILRTIAVQNGGRHKPLDSLASESLRRMTLRTSLRDPESDQRWDATAWYMMLIFTWEGWEHPNRTHLELVTDWRSLYFHLHSPDIWDQSRLLPVKTVALRSALGLGEDQTHISPLELSNVKVDDPQHHRATPFSAWGNSLLSRDAAGEALTELEREGLELAQRLWSYQNHRMGRTLELVPIKDSPDHLWMSMAQILLTRYDDTTDPSGNLRAIQTLLTQLRDDYQRHDAASFNRASHELVSALQRTGADTHDYPSHARLLLEVIYHRWPPFRISWILLLAASIAMVLYWVSRRMTLYRLGWIAYACGVVALALGFALRMFIAGRPPVTNMYESVIYVGSGVAVLGLIFEVLYGKKFIVTSGACVATFALVLADACSVIDPLMLDPTVRPLEPALRSNFWLVTHVMTISLSYAALALSMGIANITLGYYLVRSDNESAIDALSRFTYKTIQMGVLLLAAGILLGGIWADYSWGRFWGWDPKEIWALIALIGYLVVLHARFAGWIDHRGLAALSVSCFALVIMAWYGVNYVLGAGLHSYGFGGGGQGYVCGAVCAQLLYVAVALIRTV